MSISYEICTDPVLLKQYFKIRERCFRDELGLPEFDGSEDRWDGRSAILIARAGDRCVGGMRITGSLPHTPQLLPVEEEGLPLGRTLRDLDLGSHGYCQWGRLALQAEYRTPQNLHNSCRAVIQASQRLGYRYSFIVAGMNRSRLYKRLYASLGYRYEIVRGVRIPAERGFDALPHLLSVGYLSEAPRVAYDRLAQVA